MKFENTLDGLELKVSFNVIHLLDIGNKAKNIISKLTSNFDKLHLIEIIEER